MDYYNAQRPGLNEEWGVLDEELSGFTYDGPTAEDDARAAYERYHHPSEGIYSRLTSPWVKDGEDRYPAVPHATWDALAEAGYIYLQQPETTVARTKAHVPAVVNIDYDEQGEIVGIEVLL